MFCRELMPVQRNVITILLSNNIDIKVNLVDVLKKAPMENLNHYEIYLPIILPLLIA